MSQPKRLANGGLIDRERPLAFRFDGRPLGGYHGDTLASALLANGVRIVGRSFKYHRPRGVFSAGVEEPNALLSIGRGERLITSCRATQVPLHDGLVARSQNCWPGVGFDLGRLLDYTRPLWPAGFYNKTFKWPNWQWYEWAVRATAGLGRASRQADPDRYEQANVHCDLLVVGAGPAGLLAALAAARGGLRVIVAEQDERPGGSLLFDPAQIDGQPGADWAARVAGELAALANVRLLTRTTACGVYDHNLTALVQRGPADTDPGAGGYRQCLWIVRPRRIVLASGAIEQPLLFPDNDRPGIMQASAVRHYLQRYAVAAGRRVAIATNNDSAYRTAFECARAGIAVAGVIDCRSAVGEPIRAQAEALNIPVLARSRVMATSGSRGVRSVRVMTDGGPRQRLRCDLVASSGGWMPVLHLYCQAGGRLRFDERLKAFVPERAPAKVFVVGAANGCFDLAAAFAESIECADRILDGSARTPGGASAPAVVAEAHSPHPEPYLHRARSGRQWLDLQHDVTLKDAEIAVRENFSSVEHFKRYTTLGMSVDQGKTSNLPAAIALGALSDHPLAEIGTTTSRPPYTPVSLGAIAGRQRGERYRSRRLLPAHRVHQALGARFLDFSGWQRPECYPLAGESRIQAIHREALAVRTSVGVFDNSPIGKIEVRGPDAAELIDRVYINNALSLSPGRARYGLMLNENGVILDDGVFVRLAADHYLLHTTSSNAIRITDWLEEWLQCEWVDLGAMVTDVTTQWANFTLAGPRARAVLERLATDVDLSAEAFPHMSARLGTVAGVPARILRVSFSGELSYEINVPAGYGSALLERIVEAGGAFGVVPYGIEALMVLRIEKGYLHVGTETDGTTSPDDLGWGPVVGRKTRDFIGRRSLCRPENLRADRRQLVGLKSLRRDEKIPAGAHLLLGEGRRPPAPSDGWVTSACFSPTLGHDVALAMLRGGSRRHGQRVTLCDADRTLSAEVVSPVFIDPDGQRLDG